MNPSSSDWLWLPDQGLYWSHSSQSYARPNPQSPTGYDWFPVQQQQQPQHHQHQQQYQSQQQHLGTSGYDVDYGEQNGSRSPYGQRDGQAGNGKNGDGISEPKAEEGEGEGIGGVGWALDFDIPGDEKKTTYPTASSTPNASHPSTKPRPTTTDPTHQLKIARVLRLVKLNCPDSPIPSSERIALLDSRPGGYVIGRDKNPSRAVLRLKELAVSKTHAIVWFGRRDVEWDELFEQEEGEGGGGGRDGKGGNEVDEGKGGDERRFWIVDCGKLNYVARKLDLADGAAISGSTHGTFLLNKSEIDASLPSDSKRLSESRHVSSPYPITHLSRITIGNTTFECHLHPDWPCEDCALDDPSSGITIIHPESAIISSSATTSSGPTPLNNGDLSAVGPLAAGWKETEARRVALTAEAKRADTHRRSALAMKKLRESYFGGGGAAAGEGDKEKEKEGGGGGKGGGKRKWAAGGSDEGWKKRKGNEDVRA